MQATSQAGTPEWCAPEVLRSQNYNEKSDGAPSPVLPSLCPLSSRLLNQGRVHHCIRSSSRSAPSGGSRFSGVVTQQVGWQQ